ncbi:hypothetical protein [Mycolicibacter minnesotensis]
MSLFRTTVARVRDADPDVWRTAMWGLPVVGQFVLAAVFGLGWWLPNYNHVYYNYRLLITVTTGITALASFLVSAVLLSRPSSRAFGMGLAVGGAGLTILIAGLTWGLIILPHLGFP